MNCWRGNTVSYQEGEVYQGKALRQRAYRTLYQSPKGLWVVEIEAGMKDLYIPENF